MSTYKDRALDGLNNEDRRALIEAVEKIEAVSNRVRKTQFSNKSKVSAFSDGAFSSKLQIAADIIKSELTGTRIRISDVFETKS
jgi:hypothetical protein